MVFKKILYFLSVCAILIVYLTHSSKKYTNQLSTDKVQNYVKRDIGLFENSIVTTTITTDTTIVSVRTESIKPKIAACVCVKSTPKFKNLKDTALQKYLINSIIRTVTVEEQEKYTFELFIGLDEGEPFFTPERLSNLISADWLPINFSYYKKSQKHRIPFNELIRFAASDPSIEYFVRINDDTEFVTKKWVSIAIKELAKFDNIGVVGPDFKQGNIDILTHDFVYRHHLRIFDGNYYSPYFDNWYIDDWITKVYAPDRMKKIKEWRVKHHVDYHGTRYTVNTKLHKNLTHEIKAGKLKIEEYINNLSKQKFKIYILTMNRDKSLTRLLNSIEKAFYKGDKLELYIHIDKSEQNANCIKVAQSFQFSHGTKIIKIARTRNGLRDAWLNAWDPIDTERAIILEDDVEVSPYWYLWLKNAWDNYETRTDLGGISLQRQTLIPKKPHKNREIINDHKPFLYKLVGSIGFSPHPQQWKKFLLWTKMKNLNTYEAKVDGLITSDWYVISNKKSIWTQLFIKYCVIEDLYTLYINLPEKKTLATHWKEKGEHFRGNEGKDFELNQKIKLEFPTNLVKYDFDGKPIAYKITDKSADEIKYEWKIILEKACDNQKNVFITISVGGLGLSLTNNLLRSYSRIVVFIPPPNEIINTPNGKFLIHTKYLSSLKESKWGEKSHFSIIAAKALVIHNVIMLGFSVTYIDSDSVLLRYPEFLTSPRKCDIYHSNDERPMCSQTKSNACSGFLHFKNNKITQKFTKTWSSVSQKDLTQNDQCHFQRLVTKNNNTELKICSLPENKYANGWTWVRNACKKCINLNLLKQTATVVHANFLVGNSAKINTLKKAGFFEL